MLFVTGVLTTALGAQGLVHALRVASLRLLRFLAIAAAAGLIVYAFARIFDMLSTKADETHDPLDRVADDLTSIGLAAAAGALLGAQFGGPLGAAIGALAASVAASAGLIITNIQKIGDELGQVDYLEWQYGEEDSDDKHKAYWDNVYDNTIGAAERALK